MPPPVSHSPPRPVCAVVGDLEEAEALEPEWRELADACAAGPFARPGYALNWWRHVGKGQLRIVTVRQAGQLVALAPLHTRRMGPVGVVRWLGHGLATIAEALVHPDHPAVAELLWATAGGRWRVLDLVECREGCPLPAPATSSGSDVLVADRDVCPVIEVDGDSEAHLASPDRKRVRRTVRVARRRLEEADLTFDVRVVEDLAALDEVLPDLRRVFDAAEAAQPRLHLLAGEWEPFTTAVVRDGVGAGELIVLVGYAGPDAVAFDIVFVSPDTMSSWIGRFDPDAARYSPGHLLQVAGIDWAHQHGKDRIDLQLGDSYYKRLWAGSDYRTLQVESGSRAARRALRVAERLRTPTPTGG